MPEVEPEGFLHGKRVLRDGSESESEIEDAALAAGTCPFKNLTMTPGREGEAALRSAIKRMSRGEEQVSDDNVVGAVDEPTSTSPGVGAFAHSAIPQAVGSSA